MIYSKKYVSYCDHTHRHMHTHTYTHNYPKNIYLYNVTFIYLYFMFIHYIFIWKYILYIYIISALQHAMHSDILTLFYSDYWENSGCDSHNWFQRLLLDYSNLEITRLLSQDSEYECSPLTDKIFSFPFGILLGKSFDFLVKKTFLIGYRSDVECTHTCVLSSFPSLFSSGYKDCANLSGR